MMGLSGASGQVRRSEAAQRGMWAAGGDVCRRIDRRSGWECDTRSLDLCMWTTTAYDGCPRERAHVPEALCRTQLSATPSPRVRARVDASSLLPACSRPPIVCSQHLKPSCLLASVAHIHGPRMPQRVEEIERA